MKSKLGERIISFILSFNLVFNNLIPFISISSVRAQEVTPTPTEEVAVSPTAEPTVIIDEVTPTETILPTVEPTQDITPTDIIELTPAVEVTPIEETSPTVEPTLEPIEAPSVPSPPEESTPTPEMSVQPTPTTEPLMTPDGHVNTEVIDSYSCRADSLNGCLTTDKNDYAPASVAIITGYGFTPNTEYTLVVSTDGLSQSFNITTDENGSFTYSYSLYEEYHPFYTVELKDLNENIVAITSFTDTPVPSGGIKVEQWETLPAGNWITGNLGSSNSDYKEGETVPFRLDLGKLNTSGNPYTFSVCRDYQNGTKLGYFELRLFNTTKSATPGGSISSTNGPFSGINISSITYTEIGGQGACGSGQRETQVSFNVSSGSVDTYLLWGGRLASSLDAGSGNGASSFPGSSLQMQLLSPAKSVSINPGAIIELAQITVQKIVDSGSATPDQWCFNISPNITGEILPKCPSPGQNSVTFLGLGTGNYEITETTSIFGYSFESGNGTNCTFNGSTATASVTSATNATNATCIFHNSQQNGHLIVQKTTIPSDDSTIFAINATGTGIITGGGSGNVTDMTDKDYEVTPGTYSVTETVPSGWIKTGDTCQNIVVGAGETKYCLLTNTKKGHIVVDKITDPTGSDQSFTFTTTGSGYSGFSLKDTDNPNDQEVVPGSYTVLEDAVSGWDSDGGVCDKDETPSSIDVEPGETVTCTFTNTKLGSISGQKWEDLDADGIKEAGEPPVSGVQICIDTNSNGSCGAGETSTNTDSQGNYTFNNLLPGTYVIAEYQGSGSWTQSYPGTSAGRKHIVNLLAGENATGYDFGNYKPASVCVYKFNDLNGDGVKQDAEPYLSNWLMPIWVDDGQGNKIYDGRSIGSNACGGLTPGKTYYISETLKSGWAQTTPGGDGFIGPLVATSRASFTATFGNFQCATVAGTKWEDLDGDGNKDAGEPGLNNWTINLNGPENSSTTTDSNGNYTFNVCAGGDYTLTESFPNSDWYQTYPGGASPNHELTIISGGDYLGNNFGNAKYARIWGIKYRDDDGNGIMDAIDVGITLAGWIFDLYDGVLNTVIDSYTTLADGFYEFTGLFAGKSYYVKEQTKTGWTQTIGSPSPTPMTLQSGDNKEVDFANFENATIIVHKNVVKPDGTTEVSDSTEFHSLLNGSNSKLIAEGTDATYDDLIPGIYTVTEDTLPTGYALVSITDDDASTPDGQVAVTSGQTNNVYITNRQLPATLTLIKHLPNDNGGTAIESDFNVYIDGNKTTWGSHEVDPGIYLVSENTLTGYTPSSWSNGCSENGEVTLSPGESKTCEITNDDQAAHLILIKHLPNDNSGTATEDDFQPYIDGNQAVWGDNVVNAGVHTASEDTLPEYSPSGWSNDCNSEGEVILNPGETKTCEITNDDIGPKLKLVKVVDGGTGTANDWTLTATGTNGFNDFGDSNIFHTVNAETYSLTESTLLPQGYTAGLWTCDNDIAVQGNVIDLSNSLNKEITCTITNARDTGSIIVHKIIDPDGDTDNTPDDQYPAEGWEFDVNGTSVDTSNPSVQSTDSSGQTIFDSLKTGNYNIIETLQPGYELVSIGCNTEMGRDDLTASISLGKNETVECTFINSPNSTIHGYKWSDADQSGGPVAGLTEDLLKDWTINLYKEIDENVFNLIDSMTTADNPHYGWYWFEHLFPGNYKICEEEQTGWKQTYPINDNDNCHLVKLPLDTSGPMITREVENAVIGPMYNFGNVALGEIRVTKYNDLNGNGVKDENEPTLPDWTITLTGKDSQVTGVDGQTIFKDLLPGSYNVDEVQQDGWIQTNISCSDVEETLTPTPTIPFEPILTFFGQVSAQEVAAPGYQVKLEAGKVVNCEIGNEYVVPELQISKSNDAAGDKSQGDIITYTLTVKALKSKVLGVKLTDLLPKDFDFQSLLSIIKTKSDSTTEDILGSVIFSGYHSPATYELGDMNVDESITIKYTAKVGGVDPGLYKDLAYAYGTDLLDNRVLALAQPEGYVSTNFVGTTVNINANLTQNGNVDIEGEVLGASTYLPATGANKIWVIIASILTGLGLLVMMLGLFMKKSKILATILLSLVFFGFIAGSVSASDLTIRLEQSKSPTSKNDFKITYTVLDLTESPNAITVKCFKKGPADGGYSQFGGDIVVNAGGNSGECDSVSGFVNTNGTYQFYATADNSTETVTSESEGIVSVGYNTQGDPTPPGNYKKEKVSSCQYRITFRTADDGLTSRVEIYRSENTSFNLDGGTRVADISIGPNQDGTFEESVPDCNKTYYYIVRAFNSSGSPSGPVGDSAVTVTTSTTTEEGGAIPVESANLPEGQGGQVLGEEAGEASPTAKPEVVEVKEKGITGAVKGVTDFVKKKTKLSLLIVLGVLGLGYGAYYFIKKRK